MPELLHVNPDTFLVDSFRLGKKVYLSGFRPKHAISLWRGGTPVGVGVDAYFRSQGVRINHTTIATDSYVGIGKQAAVTVKNLEHLAQVICPEDGLLIIDDVYESGNTIQQVVELLGKMARANAPRQIVVATVHHKPGRAKFHDLPVIALREIPDDIWIDYPHELADLVDRNDPEDTRIREKDEDIWRILRETPSARSDVVQGEDFLYLSAREMLLDATRLGVNIAHDRSFRPDFMVALWPGGVSAGLPVHEVYKYFQVKGLSDAKAPDHISINTFPTRTSFRTQILGMHYLVDRINKEDNILILDTTFRAGRLVNAVVESLKEALRRNLDLDRVRVASVYYNPDDHSTWTVRPNIRRPDYFLKTVRSEVIYPYSFHKLPNARRDLKRLNPALWSVIYGDD